MKDMKKKTYTYIGRMILPPMKVSSVVVFIPAKGNN